MTKAQLKKHPCYQRLPHKFRHEGINKTKLSAKQLCEIFQSNNCFFNNHKAHVPAAARSSPSSSSSVFRIQDACHNDQDPITLEDYTDAEVKAAYPNDIVTVILPGQRKGECYNRQSLIDTWKAYVSADVVHLWGGSNRGSLIENKKVAKLPISGSWITEKAAMEISGLTPSGRKKKKFPLKSIGTHYMGTKRHYVGSVFGQDNAVYDLA
jgi:hypothetical protein